jgi:hypothetical protein
MTRSVARNATPAAVESGIEEATSAANQETIVQSIDPERVEEATEKVAAGATDGLVDAMSAPPRQERLTQAMEPVVAAMVNTAVESALSEEQLARIRELAKQATLGFQDAIDEVKTKKEQGILPEDQGNVLEAVDDVAESGNITLYLVGALAGLLFLLLVGGIIWAIRRKRRYEFEAGSREAALAEVGRILSDEQFRADAEAQGGNGHDPLSDAERLRLAARRLEQQKLAGRGRRREARGLAR